MTIIWMGHRVGGSSWANQRARSRRSINGTNSSLNEEPRSDSRKNYHAKSAQCASKPGASKTNFKRSERLPRTPLKAFPLREGRNDESPVLGLSRPQNAETHVSLSLDSTPQRRCPRKGHDLQPFGGRPQSCRRRARPQDSRRSGCHGRSRVQVDCRSEERRVGKEGRS